MKYALFAALIFLASCSGYRLGRGELIDRYCTVCIPFAEGDHYGHMTTALIRTMTTRGALAYRSYNADLTLKVCLMEPDDENIGFTYAPPEEKGEDNIVVSNEARLIQTARVSLIDRRTHECILGPLLLTASIDFDFEPDLSNISAHRLSLGQLEMNNLAEDAALRPLYILLAEKIVDYVNHSW